MRRVGTTRAVLTTLEIDLLLAVFANVFAIEFVGKYFNFRSAILASAGKRFQVSEGLKTGTMTAWRIHLFHLIGVE